MATDARGDAYDTIVDVLRSNQVLKDRRPVWRIYDGRPEADDPLPTDRYGVRVTPMPENSDHDTLIGQQRTALHTPMTLQIDTSTPGSDPRNSMRFWREIEWALFPTDSTRGEVEARYAAACISEIQVTRPGWGHALGESGQVGPCCLGSGSILVSMYVRL